MSARRTFARRAASSVVTLLVVTLVVFGLLHLAPGDPLDRDEDLRLLPEHRAALRALYRLDEPVHRRYVLWLGDAAAGEFGRSFVDHRPVAGKIRERLGPTLALTGSALLLALAVAVPIGMAAARRPGSALDRLTGGVASAAYALPIFWVAMVLQSSLGGRLGILPIYGLASEASTGAGAIERAADVARHLVLPVVCLAYPLAAHLSRFVRSTVAETLGEEGARAAHARGLTGWAVSVRHGLRLAAVPLLTMTGFLLPSLVGGSVLVESIFAIPGTGMLFIESILQRDVPTVMGLTLLSGTATLVGVLAADTATALFDPRVRRGA